MRYTTALFAEPRQNPELCLSFPRTRVLLQCRDLVSLSPQTHDRQGGRLVPCVATPHPPDQDTRADVRGQGAWPSRGDTHSGIRSSCSALVGHPGFPTVEEEMQNRPATSSLCLSASRRGTWTLSGQKTGR